MINKIKPYIWATVGVSLLIALIYLLITGYNNYLDKQYITDLTISDESSLKNIVEERKGKETLYFSYASEYNNINYGALREIIDSKIKHIILVDVNKTPNGTFIIEGRPENDWAVSREIHKKDGYEYFPQTDWYRTNKWGDLSRVAISGSGPYESLEDFKGTFIDKDWD